MPLTIDKSSLTIKTRSGDSGTLVFKFNMPLNDFNVDFCISKDFDFFQGKPIIQKCYKKVPGSLLEVNLTSFDTEKLTSNDGLLEQYYWGVKVHNDNGFAATVIPNRFNRRPKLFVYPKIGECPNG